jgi:very-short-patch-repair endonuclease
MADARCVPKRLSLDALLAEGGGVIAVRRHPEHRSSLYRLVEAGEFTALLPGILAPASTADHPETRMRALAVWEPGAVFTGEAAARLTFWHDLEVPVITASLSRYRVVPPAFRVSHEVIPAWLQRTVRGVQVTAPELTALDLAISDGGEAIEYVLRTGLVSVAHLADALQAMPRRRGNGLRRRALDACRRNPWSAAERLLHRLLRSARIEGWQGNWSIEVDRASYVIDLVFPALRVAIEVDGYEIHRAENQDQFHRDRRKWTDLAAAGWLVLHFTWPQLTDDQDWVLRRIRQALGLARSRVAP